MVFRKNAKYDKDFLLYIYQKVVDKLYFKKLPNKIVKN